MRNIISENIYPYAENYIPATDKLIGENIVSKEERITLEMAVNYDYLDDFENLQFICDTRLINKRVCSQ